EGSSKAISATSVTGRDEGSRHPPSAVVASATRHAFTPPVSRRGFGASITWIPLAGTVWLAGSLVVLAGLARRAWRFRRFLRLAAQRDEYLAVRVAELAHTAGVRISPRVIVVNGGERGH